MITLISISPTVNEYYLAEIAVDTVSELPNDGTITYNEATFYISAGSKAIATDTTKKYIMSSDYTWTEYTDAQTQVNVNVDLPDVYSEAEVDALLAPMQADIDSHENALIDVINLGSKNTMKYTLADLKTRNTGGGYGFTWSGSVCTSTRGVTFTINPDMSIRVQATSASGDVWFLLENHSYPIGDWIMSGCPADGSTSKYYMESDNRNARDVGSGVQITATSAFSDNIYIVVKSGQTFDLTFKPMICYKSLYDVSKDFEPFGLTNPELTSVIVEDIDGGHKNTLILTDTQTQTSATVTCTYNGDGTYTINGTANAAGYFYLARTSSNPVFKAGSVITGCTGGGSNTYKLAIAGTTLYQYGDPLILTSDVSGSLIFSFASGSVFNNMLLKPMVCSKAKYDISPAFVPYCPTLAELYALVKSYHP